jgi:hypothetical protein
MSAPRCSSAAPRSLAAIGAASLRAGILTTDNKGGV